MERGGMTVVCAWCEALIASGGEQLSHGICVSCALDFMLRLPPGVLQSIADADGTVNLGVSQKLGLDMLLRPAS